MDTGTLLIGVALFCILIIPFIFAIRHQKNKHKGKKEKFSNLAQAKNIRILKPDIINDLILGLAVTEDKLVVSQTSNMEHHMRIIDLKSFNTYRVLSQSSEYVKLALINSKNKKKEEFLFWEKPDENFPEKDFPSCKEEAQKWGEKLQLLMIKP